MTLSLQKKRALVTGGSRSIGAAIVKRLAQEGADVAFTYVSKPEQAELTRKAAEAHGVRVVAMKADWTRRDPAITRALAALGRSGVPVYALYPPGNGAPALLPQILTESAVLAEFAAFPDRPANQRAGQ